MKGLLHLIGVSIVLMAMPASYLFAQNVERYEHGLNAPGRTFIYDKQTHNLSGNAKNIASEFSIKGCTNIISASLSPSALQWSTHLFRLFIYGGYRGVGLNANFLPTSTENTTTPFVLELSYNEKDSYKAGNAIQTHNLHFLQITIDSIRIWKDNDLTFVPVGSSLYNYLIADLRLRSTFEIERSYKPSFINPKLPEIRSFFEFNTKSLSVSWKKIKGCHEYQLEWTHVDDYYVTNVNELFVDFKFNSTRVTTADTGYLIPLVFESGYLIFRVRGVSTGSNPNPVTIYTKWSRVYDLSTVPPVISNVVQKAKFQLKLVDNTLHEVDRLNWQYIASYMDDGKRKDAVTYHDGTLRLRQTVTILNSDTISVAASTIYDYQGRPAISVLPAPVQKYTNPANSDPNTFYEHHLGYFAGLNLNANSQNYSFSDFDFDPASACNREMARPFKNATGAGKYYSENNPDSFGVQAHVPSAKGYPFLHSQWTDDNTGRIKRHGSVGDSLQIGTGHEVVYNYADVSQSEIDRLFGSDAGNANFYRKVVVKDPNGQLMMQYSMLDGKIVATGLTGNAPNSLEPLDFIPVNLPLNVIDLPQILGVDGISYDAFKTFHLSTNSSLSLNYCLKPEVFAKVLCNESARANCRYIVSFELTDDCGRNIFKLDTLWTSSTNFCEKKDLLLGPGLYTIKRKLSVDTSKFDLFFNAYLEKLDLCPNQYVPAPKPVDTQCKITCTECAQIPEKDKSEDLKRICEMVCNNGYATPCRKARKSMLADMTPGGQYAQYFDTENSETNISRFQLSILNENLTRLYKFPNPNASWRNPINLSGLPDVYRHANGDTAYVKAPLDDEMHPLIHLSSLTSNSDYKEVDGELFVKPQLLLRVEHFIELFEDSWADALIAYHPEICYYEYCIKNEEAYRLSKIFDDSLQSANTAAKAIAKGYFNLDTNPDIDPGIKEFGFGRKLKEKLQDYKYNLSVKKFVLATFNGCLETENIDPNCLNNINLNLIGRTGSEEINNHQWELFRALYLAEKNKLLDQIRENYIDETKCLRNDWIGDTTFRYLWWYEAFFAPEPYRAYPLSRIYRKKIKVFASAKDFQNNLNVIFSGDDKIDAFTLQDYLRSLPQSACRCEKAGTLELLLNNFARKGWSVNQISTERIARGAAAMLLPGNLDRVAWKTVSVTQETLIATISLQNIGDKSERYCEISMKGFRPIPWNDIRKIECIRQNTFPALYPQGDSVFIAYIYDSANVQYVVEGRVSCLDFEDCKPKQQCESTCKVEALRYLLTVGFSRKKDQRIVINFDLDSDPILKDYVKCLWDAEKMDTKSELKWVFASGEQGLIKIQLKLKGRIYFNNKWQAPKDCEISLKPGQSFSKSDSVVILSLLPDLNIPEKCLKHNFKLRAYVKDKSTVKTMEINGTSSCFILANCCVSKNETSCTNLWQKRFPTTKAHVATPLPVESFGTTGMWSNMPGTNLDASSQVRLLTSRSGEKWKDSIFVYNPGYYQFSFSIKLFQNISANLLIFSNELRQIITLRHNQTDVTAETQIDLGRSFIKYSIRLPLHYQQNYHTFSIFMNRDVSALLRNLKISIQDFSIVAENCDNCCIPSMPSVKPNMNGYCDTLERDIEEHNTNIAEDQFLIDLRKQIKREYIFKCLKAIDSLTAIYAEPDYHYTLFYYDRANNLVKTVSPSGVRPLTEDQVRYVQSARTNSGLPPQLPTHVFTSKYQYNSLDNITRTETPDAGTTRSWYDPLGRLVLSQSARQVEGNRYNYIWYDELARLQQSGELIFRSLQQNDSAFNYTGNAGRLRAMISTSERNDVNSLVYDTVLSSQVDGYFIDRQSYLRNRISSNFVTYHIPQNRALIPTVYDHAIHYNYDVQGYVRQFLQEIPELLTSHQNLKRIAYKYELLTGLVKSSYYQEGQSDQFLHRYEYDPDKRIRSVETSKDGFFWDRDASYHYYKHGPLARMEIGEENLQAVDYAYTIQGWLKAINSITLDRNKDIGRGVRSNADFLSDVYGYSLGYFQDDYSPIRQSFAQSSWFQLTHTALPNRSNLFNGNTRYTVTANDAFLENKVLASVYSYDQLNRLTAAENFHFTTGNVLTASATDEYNMSLSYDANGNILQLKRNGAAHTAPIAMDSLRYNYYPLTNRLRQVTDTVARHHYPNDIDQQPANNYLYDASGNLVKDNAEQIDSILWNADGKIAKLIKDNDTFDYSYNSLGHRLKKTTRDNSTYYINDLKGNIVATYVKDGNDVLWESSTILGAKRVGTLESRSPITTSSTEGFTFSRAHKQYELTNYLGDVLITISDRKLWRASKWQALIENATDYYPYGMIKPNRDSIGRVYRFGMNGLERDDEVKGRGNSYTTEFRQYDTRLGRWLSVDPLLGRNNSKSPYSGMGNNPIALVDLLGLQEETTSQDNYDGVLIPHSEDESILESAGTSAANITTHTWRNLKGLATALANPIETAGNLKGAYNEASDWWTNPELDHLSEVYGALGDASNDPNQIDALTGAVAGGIITGGATKTMAITIAPKVRAAVLAVGIRTATPNLERAVAASPIVIEEAAPTLQMSTRVIKGGRSGELIKDAIAPPKSVLRGSPGRILISDENMRIIWDVTKERAKPVTGRGFGPKQPPTKEQLDLIKKAWEQN
jgi:RHS repeat-associated protein